MSQQYAAMLQSTYAPNGLNNQSDLINSVKFTVTEYPVNSIYSQNLENNIIKFDVSVNSNSIQGKIGALSQGSQIVQIAIPRLRIPNSPQLLTPNAIDMNFKSNLFLLIEEFRESAKFSPYNFKYHFEYVMNVDPNDNTAIICLPIHKIMSFRSPVRFENKLSFQFFTTAPYQLPESSFEVNIDYSGPNMVISRADGVGHLLTVTDYVALENFTIPGQIDPSQANQDTHRSKWYPISILSPTQFEIPISSSNSINRPADLSLGVYNPPQSATVFPANPASIQVNIPHGLVTGQYITFSSVSNIIANTLLGQQHRVTVTAPNTFEIQVNSVPFGVPIAVRIAELPISRQRQATVQLKVPSRRVEFTLQLKSVDELSKNYLTLHSVV